MTSPESVGAVSVEIIGDTDRMLKDFRKDFAKAAQDVAGKLQDQFDKTKLKTKVTPELDPKVKGDRPATAPPSKNEPTPPAKAPKAPGLDPLLKAFQQEIQRQTNALAKQLNVVIPVDADTSGLRAELGAELAAVAQQLKVKVPTEPEGKTKYQAELAAQVAEVAARIKAQVPVTPEVDAGAEAKLKAEVAAVAARAKQSVKVEVDVDKDRAGSGLATLGGLLQGIGKSLPFSGLITQTGELASGLGRAGGQATQMGSSLAGSASAAGGPIGIVIGLLATATAGAVALGAAVTFLPPLLSAAAGAAAAIPAALAGAAAAFGAIKLGTLGVGDAISEAFSDKPAGGGGGGGGQNPAARARQIAAAERGVESARRGIASASRSVESAERGLARAEEAVGEAIRRSQKAQEAVNRARKEAREDIDDLGRALRGAVLDEKSAAIAINDALLALNTAKLSGNIPEIQKADIAYQQSLLTLENAKDKTEDLGEAQADATKKGVEGSDKVVAALEAQESAQKGVRDAQDGVIAAQNSLIGAQDGLKSSYDGLKSAQDSLAASQEKMAGGSAGAATKLSKLSANAQKFVGALKALKPAWDEMQQSVQDKLFDGLDKTITKVGKAWIPALRETLGNYATTFNQFLKNLGEGISTPKFVADIQAGAEGARKGLEKIGTSITTSLVPAFGALSAAAAPFLEKLGEEIAGIVTEFSEWVLSAEKNDKLTTFFDQASQALHDIFRTGKLVSKIVVDLIDILIGDDGKKGTQTPLQSFNDSLERLHAFLSTNQASIAGSITSIKNAVIGFLDRVERVKGWTDKLFPPDAETKTRSAGQQIGSALIAGLFAGLGTLNDLVTKWIWDTLIGGDFSLIGNIRRAFGINSPSTVMMEIGVNLVEGLLLGIGAMLGSLRARAGQVKTTVLNALAGAGTWLYQRGRDAVWGAINGINSLASTVRAAAGNIRSWVVNSLASAGSWLYNAGVNTVIGLWNGIASQGAWLYNQLLSWVRANIPGPIKSALGIASPSKVAAALGTQIPAGLALGMDRGAGDVQAAAERIAAAAMPDVGGASLALASDLNAVSQSLTSSAGLEIGIRSGSTGDWLMDGLRKNIEVKYRGDVTRALNTA